jgi:hypothetical protein
MVDICADTNYYKRLNRMEKDAQLKTKLNDKLLSRVKNFQIKIEPKKYEEALQ